jgi:hypothetical protein
VVQAGLGHYLREQGHQVLTVARGSSTNLRQLAHVRREVQPGDCVLFVQTDPMRDLSVIPGDTRAFHREHELGLERLYRGLAQLPCPVLLVGGVRPVEPELIDPESPIRVAVRDWMEALGFQPPGPHLCRAWPYPDCEPELLAQWEQDERRLARWLARARIPGTPEHQWFWPDGRHPNRRAHSWLADRVLELLR